MKNRGGYFRQLSIVILGVAVTFAGSSYLNRRNTDRQLKYYFGAIKMELEENLQEIEALAIFYEHSFRLAQYLWRTPVEQIRQDSMIISSQYYHKGLGQTFSVLWGTEHVRIMTSVLETFRYQG